MDLEAESLRLLRANRMHTDGHQYTVPSLETYPYQWLWDSCFHAIVLAKVEPEAAKAELKSLVAKQFDDGMIPHMIYWKPGKLHNYEWGRQGTSALTQPPMIAYAVWEIFKHTGDQEFLEQMYEPMCAFYNYLINRRDPRDRHLIGIINPDESGEDNSPRFDAVLNVPADINLDQHLRRRLELVDANKQCNFDAELCMKRHFWVKDVPFNALLIENLRILAHIASLLERAEDEHFYELHRGLITGAMREWMFDDGVFWSTAGDDYAKLSVATWAHFVPMFADIYTPEEAEAVVRIHFHNTETFRAPYGIRTVSKQEPSYRPDGFWRGPIWMSVNWFIYRGLVRYGFKKEAAWIRDSSVQLLQTAGFREYFNPETGEGYGADTFTWGTLVLDMIDA